MPTASTLTAECPLSATVFPGRPAHRHAARMALGFSGEVAHFYQAYRRGYPASVIDAIVHAFDLTKNDVAIDLGCGTGQLALPLAGRVRAVVGVDPEADMLALARKTADDQGVRNVVWVCGTDADIPALTAVVGVQSAGVVTAATALHWMRDGELFDSVSRLVRPGGGFAVVTNGKPLWHLDTSWSHALREFLESMAGRKMSAGCGTDDAAQQRYRDHLAATGYVVSEVGVDYERDMDVEHLIGEALSTFSVQSLPVGAARERFADGVREAVGGGPFTEPVHVGLIFGVHRPRSARSRVPAR